MNKFSFVLAGALAAFATPSWAQSEAPAPTAAGDLEVRFCPASVLRPYPLDSLRGVQGLLIQNVAALNHAGSQAEISAIEISLLNGGEVQDTRRISGGALASALQGGQAMQAYGVDQLLPFQFCDGRLYGEARLAGGPTLEAGQAALVTQQVFAWRGQRDEARVTVTANVAGREVTASHSIRIDAATSTTRFRWPLRDGPWLVAAGASFHTTHRWAIPEEFALDIIAVGANGRSFRTDGTSNTDFHAYDAEVVAAADGVVVHVVTGATEAAPMLRMPGEELAAYYGRISERQAVFLAAGEPGLMGDGVVLDHGSGEYSVYAHLVPGSTLVTVGDRVSAGQTIGRLGSSGNSTEPHLHFQVCDAASAISCAGIIPTFDNINLPISDGPRPIQSGDLVHAIETSR